MSHHESNHPPHHIPTQRSIWGLVLLLILVISASVLGYWGLTKYELDESKHPDPWSISYHTLQLFALHAPHLERKVPVQLHAGRWLAALVVLAAAVKTFYSAFHAELRLYRYQLRGNHIVICGLGRIGLQLAREFHSKKVSVIAIDSGENSDGMLEAQRMGVAVVSGNARNWKDLRRTEPLRARQIIAVFDDEQTNVAIAVKLGNSIHGRVSRKSLAKKLECWVLLTNVQLRRAFQQPGIFPHTNLNYRVNARSLDLFRVAARQALNRSPVDFIQVNKNAQTIIHLVIVGFGPMGQQLALQAARIGHFANFEPIRITIIDPEDSPRITEFTNQYPQFKDVCTFTSLLLSHGESLDAKGIADRTKTPRDQQQLVTVALCWDTALETESSQSDLFQRLAMDDSMNLSLVLNLSKIVRDENVRFLAFQTRKDGFGSLFTIPDRGESIDPRIHAFGMLEDICSIESLLNEGEDTIAKALHQDYYDKQIADGRKPGSKPALFPWEQLDERFKDSNRQAADHIFVKLRSIGLRAAPVRGDQPTIPEIPELKSDRGSCNVELLSKMEHKRWCADLQLQNFRLGERDDANLSHDSLKSWDKLDDTVREWDRQQVRAIPGALRKAGYGIYPQAY